MCGCWVFLAKGWEIGGSGTLNYWECEEQDTYEGKELSLIFSPLSKPTYLSTSHILETTANVISQRFKSQLLDRGQNTSLELF